MNNLGIKNIIQFIVLLLLQVLILQNVQLSRYIHLYIFPLFILSLPLKNPQWIVLLLSFFIGLSVDIFYQTIGMHAAALLVMTMFRPFVSGILEPKGGYELEKTPNRHNLGLIWFLQYASFLLFIFLLSYFLIEAASWKEFGHVLIRTIASFFCSMVLIIITQFLPGLNR